eukprot:GHVU01071785.1.p1 GENE.GHVU01071785.1~~GHVU01071785.1.p1  ORF type:complete len:118 (+),score=13.67 GHVU01071785.1:672-1025(+)
MGSSPAFDMALMALGIALNQDAANAAGLSVDVPSINKMHGKRTHSFKQVGDFRTYMSPACIHGFYFCINPTFMKCEVTRAVITNKVGLRNDNEKNCLPKVEQLYGVQQNPAPGVRQP